MKTQEEKAQRILDLSRLIQMKCDSNVSYIHELIHPSSKHNLNTSMEFIQDDLNEIHTAILEIVILTKELHK